MAQRTKTRRPLSRERILRAALDLADEGGVEAITMRKLGGLLGFEAMSLYNHVGGKDDVLDGILDLVLAETVPPSPDVAWDAAIRESALSVHAALTRHPWSCPLLMRRVRPARMQYMDSLLGRLRTAGFSADATYSAYHVLDGHIFGFSNWDECVAAARWGIAPYNLAWAADGAHQLGHAAAVAPLADRYAAMPPIAQTRFLRIQGGRVRALQAADAGAEDVAADAFAGALAAARSLGRPAYLAPVLADYGAWLVDCGRTEEAEPLLDEARALFEVMGAHRWLEALDRMRPKEGAAA